MRELLPHALRTAPAGLQSRVWEAENRAQAGAPGGKPTSTTKEAQGCQRNGPDGELRVDGPLLTVIPGRSGARPPPGTQTAVDKITRSLRVRNGRRRRKGSQFPVQDVPGCFREGLSTGLCPRVCLSVPVSVSTPPAAPLSTPFWGRGAGREADGRRGRGRCRLCGMRTLRVFGQTVFLADDKPFKFPSCLLNRGNDPIFTTFLRGEAYPPLLTRPQFVFTRHKRLPSPQISPQRRWDTFKELSAEVSRAAAVCRAHVRVWPQPRDKGRDEERTENPLRTQPGTRAHRSSRGCREPPPPTGWATSLLPVSLDKGSNLD